MHDAALCCNCGFGIDWLIANLLASYLRGYKLLCWCWYFSYLSGHFLLKLITIIYCESHFILPHKRPSFQLHNLCRIMTQTFFRVGRQDDVAIALRTKGFNILLQLDGFAPEINTFLTFLGYSWKCTARPFDGNRLLWRIHYYLIE